MPHTANFVIPGFRALQKGTREQELYQWIRDIFIETDANTHDDCVAILNQAGFDLIGTSQRPDRDMWAANLILSRA